MPVGRSTKSASTSDLHALGGSGMGRYGTGGLADTSARANGTLDLIRSYQGLATLEWHGPKLDVYFNAGAEYAGRAADYDPVTGKVCWLWSPSIQQLGLLYGDWSGRWRVLAWWPRQLHGRHACSDRGNAQASGTGSTMAPRRK